LEGTHAPATEDVDTRTGPAAFHRSKLRRAPRRIRLPEILMIVGVILIAVAGVSQWTHANSNEPSVPSLVQPTPFPTVVRPAATPAQTPSPEAAAPVALPTAEETQAPVVLPTIPGRLASHATPVPATSAPSRIVIPSIGVDSPVVEVGWVVVERDGQLITEWAVADYAVGFHQGSAYPGNPGNTVLSGHHNIRGKVFRYLVNVEVGDEIVLYAEDRPYHYRVESKQILPEKYASAEQRTENAQLIGYFPDERLTLITCWPYTTNTHRVVVIARPVSAPTSQ
jgi:sortase A